jgi:predicted N-formylglutamate amidohydrolase
MTYAVIRQQNNRNLVVGTLWANHDHEAQSIANSFANAKETENVTVRRIEPRELPLKIINY